MTIVRAAVHAHSAWSYDARLPLATLSRLFADLRYDVVFMCEHDRGFTDERMRTYNEACAEASTEGALLVPGIEYGDSTDRVHVPVWGVDTFLGEGVPTLELLRVAREHAGFALLAHPVRRQAWKIIDPEWLELANGIEIWTRKWDGWAPNAWAVARALEVGLVSVVSLDLHKSGQAFPLAMELDLEGELAPSECVRALSNGRCRAKIGRLDVSYLAGGWPARTALSVERARRPAFRRARLVRNRIRAARHREH